LWTTFRLVKNKNEKEKEKVKNTIDMLWECVAFACRDKVGEESRNNEMKINK
jgi:hypothetical protein